MADESNAPAVADATKSVDEPAPAAEPVAQPVVAEAKPAEGGPVATESVAEAPKAEDAQPEPVAQEEAAVEAKPEAEAAGDDADAAPATDAPATNGTVAAKKTNNGKRKSGTGVPEHKKTPAKKKKLPNLRLNVSAGEMYMVAMRGYQPWPVIICDEEMLPESLLSKRPVSAKRIDGSYREDFLEGGKNAKDRRYPVMFLGTNEFAWQVNTDLLDFDLEEVKKDVESGKQGKKNKALWEAYKTAAEGHDLAHFKTVLANHEAAMQLDLEEREQKEAEKAEKAEKSAKRKSTAAAGSEDVDMEDVDGTAAPSAKKAKATKKRKKEDESDGENEKPAKTPKTTLKLSTKSKDASAAKPKKAKKKASEEAEAAPEEPPMTEEERLQKREKQVLYLRHRLQKGFLSRDQAPKDEDMANMSDYLKQLEAHEDLEAEVIKKTKVHKVLKAIIKLDSIPKEEEHNFKQRSTDLLNKWSGALAADPEHVTPVAEAPATGATNGVKHEDEPKPESVKEELADTKVEVKKDDTPAADAKPTDAEGDVSMADAEKEASKDAPAVKADGEPKVEDSTEAPVATEAAPTAIAT